MYGKPGRPGDKGMQDDGPLLQIGCGHGECHSKRSIAIGCSAVGR